MSTRDPSAPRRLLPSSATDLPAPPRRRLPRLRCSCPLVGLTLFLAVSWAARCGFGPGELAPGIRALLGRLPSSAWIDAALAVYALSALLQGLAYAAEVQGEEARFCGLCHVGFAASFYTLYHVQGSPGELLARVLGWARRAGARGPGHLGPGGPPLARAHAGR